jgi:membrane protease YdiL (CAAX protease family)
LRSSKFRAGLTMKSSSAFLTTFARTRPLLSFFALTYIFVIVAFVPQALYEFGLLRLNKFSWYSIGALFSPAVAASIVQWLAEHNFRVCRIYDSLRRLIAWIFLGPALILFSTAILPAILANKDPLHSLNWRAFLSLSSYQCKYSGGLAGLLLAPIIEEPGWRGFALPRLQTQMSPGWASVVLGFLWAGWHLPNVLIQGLTIEEVAKYTAIVTAFSVLMTLGFNASRFSILVALVMHAAVNLRGCVIEALTSHATPRDHGSIVWTLSPFLVPVALIFLTRGRLGLTRPEVSR